MAFTNNRRIPNDNSCKLDAFLLVLVLLSSLVVASIATESTSTILASGSTLSSNNDSSNLRGQQQQHQSNERRRLAFPPFLGCDQDWVFGVPQTTGECYAVDSEVCRFAYSGGCKSVTGSYRYYNGGLDATGAEPYPEDLYTKVSVTASVGCNNGGGPAGNGDTSFRLCSVEVNGVECNACTNTGSDYRVVTLTDCSNIPGILDTSAPTSMTVVAPNGGHYPLVYNETRCQHPALPGNGPTASPTVAGSKPPELVDYMVYPKLNIFMRNDNGDLFKPDDDAISNLVVDSQEFFGVLLQSSLPIYGFTIQEWSSRYSSTGGGDSASSIATANLYLNFTSTIQVEPNSDITVRDVAQVMAHPTHLSDYMLNVVIPSNTAFEHTQFISAIVVGQG